MRAAGRARLVGALPASQPTNKQTCPELPPCRCINPGNYILTAGRFPSAMGTFVNTDVNNLVQPVVLRLSVTARSSWERHGAWESSWPLKERACEPLYPGGLRHAGGWV